MSGQAKQIGERDDRGGKVRKIIHADMDAFYASVEQRARWICIVGVFASKSVNGRGPC